MFLDYFVSKINMHFPRYILFPLRSVLYVKENREIFIKISTLYWLINGAFIFLFFFFIVLLFAFVELRDFIRLSPYHVHPTEVYILICLKAY